MKNEKWKNIAGFEGKYQVSSDGRVRSLDRRDGIGRLIKGREISPNVTNVGRDIVHLNRNGERKATLISRLVAIAFVPNPKNLAQVNHLSGNKRDNRSVNLEWCTNQENRDHAVRTGLSSRGGSGAKSKLNPEQVLKIRKMLASGEKQNEIARKFGVSRALICLVASGRRWKYLSHEPER